MEKEIEELNMLVSGILEKDGKRHVCVYFSDKNRYAEGYVPECRITSQKGFSTEEISKLETFLKESSANIINQAKTVNPLKAMMKD